MKYSKYNIVSQYKGNIVLFNSYHNKAILITPELYEFVISLDNLNDFEYYHPSFYHYLIRHKFIINDSCDEVKDIINYRSNFVDKNSNEYIIFINPTMDCNFNCWYCYENKVKSSSIDILTQKKIDNFISKILIDNCKLSNIYLSFFGGEPLLKFKQNIIPIIDNFIEKCNKYNVKLDISFTTNGYLIDDDIINYFIKKKITPSFQITLDGCMEDHNKTRFSNEEQNSYEKIIINIIKLVKHNLSVRVRVNYTTENIPRIDKVDSILSDKIINVPNVKGNVKILIINLSVYYSIKNKM